MPVCAGVFRRYGVVDGHVRRRALALAQGVVAPYVRADAGLAGTGGADPKADLLWNGGRRVDGNCRPGGEADNVRIIETLDASGAVAVMRRGWSYAYHLALVAPGVASSVAFCVATADAT